MTGAEPVTIFINERVFRVRPGLAAAEAAAQLDPDLAPALRAGTAYLTDARGIRLSPDEPVGAGTILRVVRRAAEPPSRPAAEPPDADS
jgi:hypothetical protein